MSIVAPYNANPELVAMKEDLAQRKLNVKIKGILIGAGLVVGGLALAASLPFLLPSLMTTATMEAFLPLAKPLVYAAMAGGSAIVGLATMKEIKKLEIDEQYIQSYMSGKNYWGEGYREEVAERGYSMAAPAIGPGPVATRGQSR